MHASTDGGGMQSTYLPVGITVIWQKKWRGGGGGQVLTLRSSGAERADRSVAAFI